MPRDGSNVYSQPFPIVIEGTTVESAVYNGFTTDVTLDLNWPRPIIAGGTGASNAHDAMIALSGEIAKQAVTNYDSHPWVNGSFTSLPGATSAPTANGQAGIYYEHSDPGYATIEARDMATGTLYVRRKSAGVWGAWAAQAGDVADLTAAADAAYVNVAGDTMTGSLAVNGNVFSGAAGATGTYFFGSGGTKQLNYDGTNFNFVGGPLIASLVWSTGAVTSAQSVTTGTFQFGSAGSKYLQYDGGNFNLVGGGLFANSVVSSVPSGNMSLTLQNTTSGHTKYMRVSATAGLEFINTANTVVIATLGDTGTFNITEGYYSKGVAIAEHSGLYNIFYKGDGTGGIGLQMGSGADPTNYYQNASHAFRTAGGALTQASITLNGVLTLHDSGGSVEAGRGYRSRTNGASGPYRSNVFNLDYNSGDGKTYLWVDSSGFGWINTTSDYRTKKDVTELPGMWDTVKALRPIKYTQKKFSPPAHLDYIAKLKADKAETIPGDMFLANDTEQWGFIAHELQETLTPSASSGVKDSPDMIQSPNPLTVIAALTKALQEAMTRIEALEAR